MILGKGSRESRETIQTGREEVLVSNGYNLLCRLCTVQSRETKLCSTVWKRDNYSNDTRRGRSWCVVLLRLNRSVRSSKIDSVWRLLLLFQLCTTMFRPPAGT